MLDRARLEVIPPSRILTRVMRRRERDWSHSRSLWILLTSRVGVGEWSHNRRVEAGGVKILDSGIIVVVDSY